MAEYNEKVNNGTEDRSKKTVISAVVAVAVAIAVAIVILIAKEPIFLSVSRSLAANHSYDAAEFFVQLCSSDEADILDEYIDLRQDINENYGLMVSDFDRAGIEEWQKSAEKVSNNIGAVGENLEPEALALSEALDKICKLLNDYDDLRPEIMELLRFSMRLTDFMRGMRQARALCLPFRRKLICSIRGSVRQTDLSNSVQSLKRARKRIFLLISSRRRRAKKPICVRR